MPHIDDIRRLWSEGRDVTDIARMTGHDRKTVRKYLHIDDFSPEAPAPKAKGPSKLDPFKDYIDRTLEADLHEWRKQRHTATRIYGEILEMGYEGKYSLVQCYVRERKKAMRQAPSAFLDLVWAPGTAQCDFGEADFWWNLSAVAEAAGLPGGYRVTRYAKGDVCDRMWVERRGEPDRECPRCGARGHLNGHYRRKVWHVPARGGAQLCLLLDQVRLRCPRCGKCWSHGHGT